VEVYEAIRTRKSVREYRDTEVEQEKLERILEAARLAPSASNRQEWRFVVVRDQGKREQLATEAAKQPFIAGAPVLLVCCAQTDHHRMRCGIECYPVDVAIAIDHITLAAAAEGLGTCWIGAFDPKVVRRVLSIPESIEIVELLPLGYPADPAPVPKSRHPLKDIVRYERW
jgi:nitroreductase